MIDNEKSNEVRWKVCLMKVLIMNMVSTNPIRPEAQNIIPFYYFWQGYVGKCNVWNLENGNHGNLKMIFLNHPQSRVLKLSIWDASLICPIPLMLIRQKGIGIMDNRFSPVLTPLKRGSFHSPPFTEKPSRQLMASQWLVVLLETPSSSATLVPKPNKMGPY